MAFSPYPLWRDGFMLRAGFSDGGIGDEELEWAAIERAIVHALAAEGTWIVVLRESFRRNVLANALGFGDQIPGRIHHAEVNRRVLAGRRLFLQLAAQVAVIGAGLMLRENDPHVLHAIGEKAVGIGVEAVNQRDVKETRGAEDQRER